MPSALRMLLDLLARPERYRYGPHRCHRADLHLPSMAGPHPVAVVIHGGHWRATYGKLVCRAIAMDLARRGIAAWNIEYRRLGRGQGGGWPSTFDDVGAAIDHLPAAAEGRLRLDAVAVVGHSAGGQLALWAAGRRAATVGIASVVALAAVCDLPRAGSAAVELLGGTREQVPERYAAADPMGGLPLGIPVLLVHGADDRTVPVSHSRVYAQVARRLGDPVELLELPSAGHRAYMDPRSPAWRAAAGWLAARV